MLMYIRKVFEKKYMSTVLGYFCSSITDCTINYLNSEKNTRQSSNLIKTYLLSCSNFTESDCSDSDMTAVFLTLQIIKNN